jgi:hypothetical protein
MLAPLQLAVGKCGIKRNSGCEKRSLALWILSGYFSVKPIHETKEDMPSISSINWMAEKRKESNI